MFFRAEVRNPPCDVSVSLHKAIRRPTSLGLSHAKPGGAAATCLQGYTAVAVGIHRVTLSSSCVFKTPDLPLCEAVFHLAQELPGIVRKAELAL